MENNNQKQNIDIAVLKTELNNLEKVMTDKIMDVRKDVNDIKNNDLKHIYKRLSRIERSQAYYAGGIAVLVILINIFL